MKPHHFILSCLLALSLTTCTHKSTGQYQTPNDSLQTTRSISDSTSSPKDLIGRHFRLEYTDAHYLVDYLTADSLHWELLSDDKPQQGTEKVSIVVLGSGHYFINWIEDDSTTVSQILDLKKHRVVSFVTIPSHNTSDPNVQAGRYSLTLQGKIIEQ